MITETVTLDANEWEEILALLCDRARSEDFCSLSPEAANAIALKLARQLSNARV